MAPAWAVLCASEGEHARERRQAKGTKEKAVLRKIVVFVISIHPRVKLDIPARIGE
jgi:hypothetical protein